ncbi:MAG: hypothetical protein VKJ04_03215 [Vampirovibrionales bacterium]|nr:hypothetical protein [Vampirovibrionales bacterium]
MLQAIVELIGPAGSGKSILSQLLVKTIQPVCGEKPINVLLIDACIDQGLSYQLMTGQLLNTDPGQSMADEASLTRLVQHLIENEARYRLKGNGPIQRQEAQQAIDWEFSNLPLTIALDGETDVDLLTVGLLTEHLPKPILDILRYGFTRFLNTYDYVVVDGYHPLIHPMLLAVSEAPILNTLVISHPSGKDILPTNFQNVKTPALVITQFRGEPFSQALQAAIEQQEVKLVGKMPVFAIEDVLSPSLVTQFYDCLRFIDMPLTHTQMAKSRISS